MPAIVPRAAAAVSSQTGEPRIGRRQIQQRGLHPRADVIRKREAQLEEDRADVLLDGALGPGERVRDRRVALALRDLELLADQPHRVDRGMPCSGSALSGGGSSRNQLPYSRATASSPC